MATMIRGLTAPSSILALSILSSVAAGAGTQLITGTSIAGVTRQLAVDRTPALYTGDFGDCLDGQSLLDVTKFDAAYYTDNSTVLFHLDGTSSMKNESIIMHISMDAYGENRFQMTFDPCFVNIDSLCPLNASVPVTGWAVFSVGPQQVGDIPSLAFAIPDFEGSVRLQIFGNSTQSEIACFQASLTNGNTLAYPKVVSPILAVFVLVAMLASLSTAAHGVGIPAMRTHYAHSLSVMVLFETFQTIFFSGALQLEFPSVLPAWWSNFAWSAGQIYSPSVLRTVDMSSGIRGNASEAGDARPSVELITTIGESLVQQIYGPSAPVAQEATRRLQRRYNASDPYDYTWAGTPVSPGVDLPGTWTGFPGTLAALDLPAADAFAVGLIWLLVLIAILVFSLAVLKLSTEALVRTKRIREDRLAYFRGHWVQYIVVVVLRTLFAAFAMIATLACYRFSTGGSPSSMALAAIIFVAFLLGVGGLVARACRTRLGSGRYVVEPDRIVFVRATAWRFAPLVFPSRSSSLAEKRTPDKTVGSLPFARIRWHRDDDDDGDEGGGPHRVAIHEDEPFVKRFGWLTARYRRTRWWFPACHLAHQLVRAAIVGGGGSASPAAQVYCLLIYDILSFAALARVDPFEGRRNAALAVWMLGLARVLTTGLSVAFLPALDVGRIVATAIGVIIVVVQGLLVVGAMVLVGLGAVSSHMSLARDDEDGSPGSFRPARLAPVRARYLAHLEQSATDVRVSRAERRRLAEEEERAAAAAGPSFRVRSVRRVSKIYDEDEDALAAALMGGVAAGSSSPGPAPARAASVRSARGSDLPRGARPYRASWTSQDLAEWDALERPVGPPAGRAAARLSRYSAHGLPTRILDTFKEEDNAVLYTPDYKSSHDRALVDGRSGASSRTEARRPSTPASSGPSSMTAVETPGTVAGKASAEDLRGGLSRIGSRRGKSSRGQSPAG